MGTGGRPGPSVRAAGATTAQATSPHLPGRHKQRGPQRTVSEPDGKKLHRPQELVSRTHTTPNSSTTKPQTTQCRNGRRTQTGSSPKTLGRQDAHPVGSREMRTRAGETPRHGPPDSPTPTRSDKCRPGRADAAGGDVTQDRLFGNSPAAARTVAHGLTRRPRESTAAHAAETHGNTCPTKP